MAKTKRTVRKFGAFLKNKRLKGGMTQSYLADHLGYKPQFVANWERGMSNPPETALPKISTLLKIPKSEMVKFLLQERKEELDAIFKK